jgi:hypothetical protein
MMLAKEQCDRMTAFGIVDVASERRQLGALLSFSTRRTKVGNGSSLCENPLI